MLDPYTYRCPAGHPDPCPVCSGGPHLEEILQYEGPDTVAAVILETVTGTNGVIVPPDGYLQSIRETCDRHGILLITDEVMAGFGRTGKWFGVDNWDVVPDILTVAKGINSGYVPLGAMIIREPIARWVRDKYFAGGLTYSGPPARLRVGGRLDRGLPGGGDRRAGGGVGRALPRARSASSRTGTRRSATSAGSAASGGSSSSASRETKEMLVPFNATGEAAAPIMRVAKAALERGLYLMVHWNVVMVCPPLTITPEELDEGVAILDEVLSIADEYAA